LKRKKFKGAIRIGLCGNMVQNGNTVLWKKSGKLILRYKGTGILQKIYENIV